MTESQTGQTGPTGRTVSDRDRSLGLVPTRNERLAAYQQCPALLIEELEFVFIDAMHPEHIGLHRKGMDKLKVFCPDRIRMMKAVAKAIIETVTNDERNMSNG